MTDHSQTQKCWGHWVSGSGNNVQAIKSKTPDLRDYICSTDMDIFALTETWLTEKDVAAKIGIHAD